MRYLYVTCLVWKGISIGYRSNCGWISCWVHSWTLQKVFNMHSPLIWFADCLPHDPNCIIFIFCYNENILSSSVSAQHDNYTRSIPRSAIFRYFNSISPSNSVPCLLCYGTCTNMPQSILLPCALVSQQLNFSITGCAFNFHWLPSHSYKVFF